MFETPWAQRRMEINTDLHTSSSSIGDSTSVMACKEEGVKLFGVRLTESSMMMRKAVSMGNLSCYNSMSSQAPQSSTPEHSESGDPHGYVSDGLVQHSGTLRERKKGVPWTEDEHRMFLVGLQKLGKGDWRGISRNFVPSRTPTQVASHAQKYFLRQSNLNKRKRRSSLFDIISSNMVPTSNTVSHTPMEPNPKLSFNLAAPITTFETPKISLESAPLNMNSLQSDLTNISAELSLGRAHDAHQKPQQRWLHSFSSQQQQADVTGAQLASSSTADCRQLLPPLGFMSQNEMARSRVAMASSSSSATASTSLTSLCRIDEAADPAANLRLSIGPPLLLEPMELSLKLEQPVSRHSVAMAGGSNNSNAIRVV